MNDLELLLQVHTPAPAGGPPAPETPRRWGVRWCADHDRPAARCEFELAVDDPPAGHEPELTSGGNAIWLTCSCGTTGPRRTGDPDSAWAMALADRAAHLAGDDLPIPVEPAPADPIPTAEELLHA